MAFQKISTIFGILLIVMGILLLIAPHIPFLGKLPGDIHIKGDNVQFHFPIVTCLVISLVLTVLFNLFFGGWR